MKSAAKRRKPPAEWSRTRYRESSVIATTKTRSKKSSSQLARRSPSTASVRSRGGWSQRARPSAFAGCLRRTHIARILHRMLEVRGELLQSLVLWHLDSPRIDAGPCSLHESLELELLLPQERMLRQLLLALADESGIDFRARKAHAEDVRPAAERDDHAVRGDQRRLAVQVAERHRLTGRLVHFLHAIAQFGMRRQRIAVDDPGRVGVRRRDPLDPQVREHRLVLGQAEAL